MARQGARRTAGRRFWNDPVLQFVAAGVVALVVLLVGAAWLSERAARREAVDDAEATAELLVRSVVEPGVPSGLDDGRSAALDRFDRLIRGRVLSDEVLRIKVWAADGQIVYSDKTQVIGERFELEPDELEILVEGGSDAEASDLTAPENRYERPFGELVEVYTRVVDPDGTPLLFEAYFSADEIRERGAEVRSAFRPITVGGLALFLACTIPIVWLLARRLDAAADDRERLLLAAADASDAERRRIARDLHDGVVQDLAGASFELSAAARDARAVPQLAGTLEGVGASVRHSLRSLRSLLVEIYPPELRTAGLAAALDDLVAPAIASGIDVVLTVDDTAELDDDVVALVWRAAQEAVRNAVRHGSPTRLAINVTVRRHPHRRRRRRRLRPVGARRRRPPRAARRARPGGRVRRHVRRALRRRGGHDRDRRGAGVVIRVVLADDHPMVRVGLERLLGGHGDIEVVGRAADGDEAVRCVIAERPDVVLMDLQMPGVDGVEATRRIVAALPDTQIVILTSFSDRERIVAALDAGAIGYLLKDAEPDDLLEGVRAAARGESPLHPRAARQLIAGRRGPVAAGSDEIELTPREAEVLGLVRHGLANKQIARRLGISERTVKAHLTSAFARIGVSDRTQAALWAERRHLG